MTRIARTALSMLASVAMLTPNVAMAQAANPAPVSYFTHDEIVQCYEAAGIYFIFSDDADTERTALYTDQVSFWLDQMQPVRASYDAELDAIEDENYARLQAIAGQQSAPQYLTEFADTFNACSEKWNSAKGNVVRKNESPDAPATSFTMEESKECLFNTMAFLMVAARDPNADLDALSASGEFWADETDKISDISEEEEAQLMARVDTMLADSLAATTDEQTAAFLAPYQDGFIECEAKRKTATGA